MDDEEGKGELHYRYYNNFLLTPIDVDGELGLTEGEYQMQRTSAQKVCSQQRLKGASGLCICVCTPLTEKIR